MINNDQITNFTIYLPIWFVEHLCLHLSSVSTLTLHVLSPYRFLSYFSRATQNLFCWYCLPRSSHQSLARSIACQKLLQAYALITIIIINKVTPNELTGRWISRTRLSVSKDFFFKSRPVEPVLSKQFSFKSPTVRFLAQDASTL